MNEAQREILYTQKKKSMTVAYVIGLFFGGFGFHYLYLGKTDYFLVVLALAITSMVVPALSVVWAAVVLAGVVHTYYVVHGVNANIKQEIDVLYPDSE